MTERKQAVPKTPGRAFEPTEFVAQASGYVIENGKRVDKFALTSPVFYDAASLQAWLADVPENARLAVEARDDAAE
jgi:hypothetical protein